MASFAAYMAPSDKAFKNIYIFNIPGVSKAVYKHLCHLLIDWIIKWVTDPLCKYLQVTFTPKPSKLGTSNFEKMFTSHHMTCGTCHVSHVTCHNYFFLESAEASRWRVCYKRGLPCLVFVSVQKTVHDDMDMTNTTNKLTVGPFYN